MERVTHRNVVYVTISAGVAVDVLGRRITQGAWPQQRQHHVRAAADTPVAQRLTEVFVIALQAHFRADINDAQQAEGGVENDSCGINACGTRFGLQDIVGQVAHIADITEEVVNAVFDKLRRHVLVALGQGFERVSVEHIVELVNRAVDAFPRIIFRGCLGNERNQHHTGAYTNPG
ncbi:hypothetical protein D3C81_1118750 [compost metagenome]